MAKRMSAPPFESVLIANRGEIACRVAASCRRLGIRTVAVYSEADAGAMHVEAAAAARAIGPAPARESYLRIDAILDAARASDARAIHPGYGFLAENADFAEACAAAGIVFVGPPPEAIRAMGSKSAARRLMRDAGVPVLPGYDGEEGNEAALRAAAARIGYPLLVKPSAGGGGRGLRRVEREEELAAAIGAARREAAASFGDDRLLLERCLDRARHIEVQVFADRDGNAIQLGERDCSAQRRYQKVVEEAPAPGLAAATRAALGEAAVAAARAVGYVGAGTVEFLLDPAGGFHFLEMNTRLQVEHPVTEAVTGLDLVEWQIRVAAGEALPWTQADVRAEGHAIEARIYAEDPAQGFAPAAGTVAHLRLPPEAGGVRIDRGVRQGDAITPHYDPMIAKLIVHGDDRADALTRLRTALDGFEIAGIATNLAFLARLAAHPSFADGAVDTGFVDRAAEALTPPAERAPPDVLAAAALAVAHERATAARARAAQRGDPHSPWSAARGWRLNGDAREEIAFVDCDGAATVTVAGDRLELPDGAVSARLLRPPADGRLAAEIDGRRITANVVRYGDEIAVFAGAARGRLTLRDPVADAEAEAADADAGAPTAPMPGVVVAVTARPGAEVAAGAALVVIEAMKVEHTIRAPAAGVIEAVHVRVGDAVDEGAELVGFRPTAGGGRLAPPGDR